jgi:hypothetical protein
MDTGGLFALLAHDRQEILFKLRELPVWSKGEYLVVIGPEGDAVDVLASYLAGETSTATIQVDDYSVMHV